MIKSKKVLLALSALFLLTEAVLGVLLQTAQGAIPFNIRYTAVIAACLFCALFAEKSLAYLLTQIALICTVGADYFLVWRSDAQRLPAMLFFSVVQTAYFLRLYFEHDSQTIRRMHLILRAVLSLTVAGITVAVLGQSCDAVALVSMIYYVNLILNAVFAFVRVKKNPIFAIGLALFILCDTVIGLSLLHTYLPVAGDSFMYQIIHPGFDLAWAFYLPSQALLAISLLPERIKRERPPRSTPATLAG